MVITKNEFYCISILRFTYIFVSEVNIDYFMVGSFVRFLLLVRCEGSLNLRRVYTTEEKWHGSDKKWNGSHYFCKETVNFYPFRQRCLYSFASFKEALSE